MRYTYDQPDYLDKNGLIHLIDELRTLIEEIVNGNLDVSQYATKEELSSYATKLEIPSLDGYATKSYVDENIADVATSGEIDLSNYVTKDKVYNKEEIDTKITEIKPITTDEIRALFVSDGLATKEDVSTAINSIPATDLSNYYTKTEVDFLIDNISGSTDNGGENTDNGDVGVEETPTPTVTGTTSIKGTATIKVGFARTYTGSFFDADGTEITDRVGAWTVSDCTFTDKLTQEITDNKIKLTIEDVGLIGETLTLTFSDPSGNFTSSSITATVIDIV